MQFLENLSSFSLALSGAIDSLGCAAGPVLTIIGAAPVLTIFYAVHRKNKIPDYRAIYTNSFGLYIPKGWQVHHIDGNRRNNTYYNLVALPYGLHRAYHSTFFALGNIPHLIRSGSAHDFTKAKRLAAEHIEAGEYIGIINKHKKDRAFLDKMKSLFESEKLPKEELDKWQKR